MKIKKAEIKTSHMSDVLNKASSALLIRILGTILGFIVSVMIARMLGAEGSGIYFLTMSVLMVAATISRLGFDNTLVRFIASHASCHEWGDVQFIYKTVLKIVSVAAFFVSILLFFSAELIAHQLFHKDYMVIPLQLISFAVLPVALAMIHAESLRGLKCIPASQWIKTVLVSLFTLLLLYPFIDHWGANGAVAAYTVAALVTMIISLVWWHKAWKDKRGDASVNTPTTSSKVLFQSSSPLFVVAITGLVMQQAATLFLGVWGSATDVGVFNVANRISALLLFPLMAMISILTPKFSEMYRNNQMDELKVLARKSSKMLMIFATPVALFVGFESKWILSLFGSEFSQGSLVLIILLVGVVVNASTGAVSELLMMTGNEKSVRNIIVIASITIFVLNSVLVPSYGVIGAAVASSSSFVLLNTMLIFRVYKVFGFCPLPIIKGWG